MWDKISDRYSEQSVLIGQISSMNLARIFQQFVIRIIIA
jgi:hypothetical protein